MRYSRPRHRALRRAALGLAIILALGFAADAVVLMTTRAHADAAGVSETLAKDGHAPPADANDRVQLNSSAESGPRQYDPGTSRATLFRRLAKGSHSGGTEPWSLAMIAVTLALAALGGIVAVSRRYLPNAPGPGIQVVGRASLSPKHTVYMLRVGRRVFLVGAGPQEAPSLISELDELSETEADSSRGEQP